MCHRCYQVMNPCSACALRRRFSQTVIQGRPAARLSLGPSKPSHSLSDAGNFRLLKTLDLRDVFYASRQSKEANEEALASAIWGTSKGCLKRLLVDNGLAGAEVAEAIASRGSRMEELSMPCCKGLSDAGLQKIAAACTKLRRLCVGGPSRCVGSFSRCTNEKFQSESLATDHAPPIKDCFLLLADFHTGAMVSCHPGVMNSIKMLPVMLCMTCSPYMHGGSQDGIGMQQDLDSFVEVMR